MEHLSEGDTLVLWKLDRLGRSVKHLVDLVTEPHKRGVHFQSLTDAINTGTPSGRIGGQKRQMTDSKIESAKKRLSNGVPPRDVAKDLSVCIPTLSRWIPA